MPDLPKIWKSENRGNRDETNQSQWAFWASQNTILTQTHIQLATLHKYLQKSTITYPLKKACTVEEEDDELLYGKDLPKKIKEAKESHQEYVQQKFFFRAESESGTVQSKSKKTGVSKKEVHRQQQQAQATEVFVTRNYTKLKKVKMNFFKKIDW